MNQVNQPKFRHTPVLVDEVCALMINDRSGVYIDGTFGLGGHSKVISSLVNADATLIGIDQDESALAQFDPSLIKQTLHLRCTNFENWLMLGGMRNSKLVCIPHGTLASMHQTITDE